MNHVELIEAMDRAYDDAGLEGLQRALAGEAAMAEGAEALVRFTAEHVDPEVEVDLTGWEGDFPLSERYSGVAGWTEFWREWLEPWDRYSYRRIENHEEGEWVLSDVVCHARGRGSGIPLEWRFVQAFRFRDGRMLRMSTHPDLESARDVVSRAP